MSLLLTIGAFLEFLPLDLANTQVEIVYGCLYFYGFPLAILLTLSGSIQKADGVLAIIVKTFVTLIVAAASLVIMVIWMFTSMCGWYTTAELFENKEDPELKIATRDFGCGATDSSPNVTKVFKVRHVTDYMIWYVEADTNRLDMREWKRIPAK
jgi:hypothetical protein